MASPKLNAFIRLRCPKCLEGGIFYGFYSMHEQCSNCSLKFEREPGYFAGAMAISYAFGFFIILPLILIFIVLDAAVFTMIFIPTLVLALFSPLVFRYSRAAWMYLDRNLEK